MKEILSPDFRKKVIENLEKGKARKEKSLEQSEIYNDRLYKYVVKELRRHFSDETVSEMPVASFINFPRRIVKNLSSIYKNEPERVFGDITEDLQDKLEKIYHDGEVDWKLRRANEYYNLQDQTHLMVIVEDGKLVVRNFFSHQLDVIQDPRNPERAVAYIIRSRDESKKEKKADVYTYWDSEFNFIFNGDGEILNPDTFEPVEVLREEDIVSPIAGHLPFIDVANSKDSEYWVRSGNSVTDFGIQYNTAFSDTWNIIRMQGYSVGVLKGPEELMPESIKLGPNYILRLKTSSQETYAEGNNVDFKFVSPSPDVKGSIEFLEIMLQNFLVSRGLDPKEMARTGSQSYSSALERLLAMIDKFEASKDDFKLFRKVETQLYNLIKVWAEAGHLSIEALPESSEVFVEYVEPQMLKTPEEELELMNKKRNAGVLSLVDHIMLEYEVDRDEAKIILNRINKENNEFKDKLINEANSQS